VLSRRGATLIELLVAMTLTTVVLGAATASFLRQRRSADDHASRARAESQLRVALAELQVALDGLSASAGDLVPGEARDTAFQLRTVVASAIACDDGAGEVLFAADDPSSSRASGFAAAPRLGDTVWWRASSAAWIARRVADVSSGTGVCAIAGANARPLLRLAFALPDTVPRGAPIRVTRQARFSFYRAGDGTWQLGISEWSEVLHAFAPPQPIAGPFALTALGGARTGFHYFDAGGSELPIGVSGASVANVARARIVVIAPVRRLGGAAVAHRVDSLDVALRNGP